MFSSLSNCSDTVFGPAVASSSCRGGFDFTLVFEETILSILPAALFLVIGSWEAIYTVRQRKQFVDKSWLLFAKFVLVFIFAAIQAALVTLWAINPVVKTSIPIVSAVIGLVIAVALAVVSHVTHKGSPRPSFAIVGFLFISFLLDLPRVRTLWLRNDAPQIAATLTASLAVKALLLVAEAIDKRSILVDSYRDVSTEETSSIFSRGLFTWLYSLLTLGAKKTIDISHLFAIHERLQPSKVFQELRAARQKGDASRKNRLAIATLRAWPLEIVKIVFPRLLVVFFSLIQPFVIQAVLENILAPDTQEVRSRGYGIIGAVALLYSGNSIATGFYEHLTFRLIASIRGGLITIIYDHISEISMKAAADKNSSLMTLIGADVERICETWEFFISDLWASTLQLGIAVWLLQRQLGVVCIAPVLFAVVSTVVSTKTGEYLRKRQSIWFEAVQKRVNFTSNALSNIKTVKMLGLNGRMQQFIQKLREDELNLAKRYRRVSSLNVCLINFPDIAGQLITFAAFAIVAKLRGNDQFTISTAITSLSILGAIMAPLSQLLYAIPQAYAALGCFRRIEKFLTEGQLEDIRELMTASSSEQDIPVSENKGPTGGHFIVMENASIGWDTETPVVTNISMKADSESPVVCVVGPVASGKSTVLKSLLGETQRFGGRILTGSKGIAFCDQSSWIPTGSIRESIVGKEIFDMNWYRKVVSACALDIDISAMTDGDATDVGTQGMALSGGQRQRLAIARALYSKKPMAIFDDVTSALDAETGEIVMSRVFGRQGLLRQLQTITIVATHSTSNLDIADDVIILNSHGQVIAQGPPSSLDGFEGISSTPREEVKSDADSTTKNESIIQTHIQAARDAAHADRRIGDFAVYKYYFSSLGPLSLGVFLVFVAGSSAAMSMQQAWIKLWSESKDSDNLGFWLSLYGLWAVLRACGLISAAFYIYVRVVPKSGKRLHASVLQAAFNAPMEFYSKIETGNLVNRFSQDMQLVDMILPAALVTTAFQALGVVGMSALAITATPYFAAVLPIIIGVMIVLQRFYLRTSKQLRLLELESKAPMYSHVIDTVNGLVTLRAFGWLPAYREKYFKLLGDCQKPFYLLLCIQRWLSVVLGLMVAVLATILTTLAVCLRGKNVSAGFTGVALVNMMALSRTLASLIVFWTSLETSLGAVSRVKTFSEDTPVEEQATGDVPEAWPNKGSIKFDGWTAAYSDFTALKNLSLDIKAGEKIAICGRTGSGKSSTIASILGMVDGKGGSITLDGVDLSLVSKDAVRNGVTCITQDPFTFPESLRLNMDPFEEHEDEVIEQYLVKVGLWTVAVDAAEASSTRTQVLDMDIDKIHFSHGQLQLFCLARGLLRNKKLMLLDEPTSSVDATTESQMWEVLDRECKDSTIITVTHRLSRIRSFDRVIVLEAGEVAECGAPDELLDDTDSVLSRLYRAQGEMPEIEL